MSRPVDIRELEDYFVILEDDNGERKQWEFQDVRVFPVANVWTVVEGDDGDLYAEPGFRVVNRIYYLVTREQWTEDDAEHIWLA